MADIRRDIEAEFDESVRQLNEQNRRVQKRLKSIRPTIVIGGVERPFVVATKRRDDA